MRVTLRSIYIYFRQRRVLRANLLAVMCPGPGATYNNAMDCLMGSSSTSDSDHFCPTFASSSSSYGASRAQRSAINKPRSATIFSRSWSSSGLCPIHARDSHTMKRRVMRMVRAAHYSRGLSKVPYHQSLILGVTAKTRTSPGRKSLIGQRSASKESIPLSKKRQDNSRV